MNSLSTIKRPLLSCIAIAVALAAQTDAATEKQVFDPEPGSWFEVSRRKLDFSAPPVFDLSSLNEPVAGQKGRVTLRDGALYLGDGTPVRFFGNATGKFLGEAPLKPEAKKNIDDLVSFMAHNGMNLHRLRTRPLFLQEDPLVAEPTRLDAFFYTVAEAKKRGIYTLLSPFFPLTNVLTGDGQVAGMKKGDKPFGVLFFSPEMQALYKGQLRVLLKTKNPYTGMTLAEDPALAFIELVNEDNLFFFTLNPKSVPPEQWAILEKEFGTWLAKRFGSLDKALSGFDKGETDSASQGRATFLPASALTKRSLERAEPGRRKRAEAQVEFMTWLQRKFFTGMMEYCRNELGAKTLFIPGNWRTADPELTDALERYSYTVGDMLDLHRYYSPQKQGGPAWLVINDCSYTERCTLLDPFGAPLQFFDYTGRADSVSEINWSHPNYYRADFLPMVASYGSLQGLDMVMPFCFDSSLGPALPWNTNTCSTPVDIASLPASVLIFRRDYVARSEPVAKQVLALPELYALKGAAVGAQGEDALRQTENSDRHSEGNALPALAFYAGRITRSFSEEKSSTEIKDLRPFIDETRKVVKSVTGQLTWDYGNGRVLINTPKAQGALGFLAEAGKIELPALSVNLKNTYGQVLLVSLDDLPLAQSRRMLLQVVTGQRPKFWKSELGSDGRTQVKALVPESVAEKEPWMVQSPVGTVQLAGAGKLRITPLDLAGKRSDRSLKISAGSQGTGLELDDQTLLYLVEGDSH